MTLRAHFGSPKYDGSERPHAWPWPCQRLLHPVWQPGDQWGGELYGLWFMACGYSHMLHVWYIYLQNWLIKMGFLCWDSYSSTMVRIQDCMVLLWHDMGWYGMIWDDINLIIYIWFFTMVYSGFRRITIFNSYVKLPEGMVYGYCIIVSGWWF